MVLDCPNTTTMWCMACRAANTFQDVELITWIPPRCRQCGSTALARGSVFDALFQALEEIIPNRRPSIERNV